MAQSKVTAEVTGVVLTIETEVGASVKAGDTLVIVESMKMEIPVVAPVAGKIVSIHVTVSEPIEEGQLVVVIAS